MVPENAPVPEPIESMEWLITGDGVVPYTTPLAVMVPPPSLVIFPPTVAVELVIPVTVLVVKLANAAPAQVGNPFISCSICPF